MVSQAPRILQSFPWAYHARTNAGVDSDVKTITVTVCEPPQETEIRPIPTEVEPPAPPMTTTLPIEDSTIVTVNPPSTTSVVKWTSSMEIGVPTTTADEVSSTHTTSLVPTPEGNVAAKLGVPVAAMGPLLAMAFMRH